MGFYIHLITTKVLHSYFTFSRRTFKKNYGSIFILKKEPDLALKQLFFTGPKWLHLEKNKLYDIKLQNYTRLIAKNGMIWRIASSVFKILEHAH